MLLAIWGVAAVAYVAFRLWYDGLRRPLRPAEIERFSEVLNDQEIDAQTFTVIRRFMEEDDGREFLMANLVELHPSPLAHPDSGKSVEAIDLLQEYYKPFMGKMLRRAGHPVVAGRGVGGYFDAWNTPPDPGWSVCGLIRYRSRRDAIAVSFADPSFAAVHKYKVAAMKQTFAFPIRPVGGLYASPRMTVAVVLALGAAVLQLILT